MSDNIDGPWEYKGIISEVAGNSNTTHPAIVEFKGKNYFFSHIGGLGGGSGSRSVIVEPLCYNEDGTIRKVNPSTSGTSTLHSALDNKHNPILRVFMPITRFFTPTRPAGIISIPPLTAHPDGAGTISESIRRPTCPTGPMKA